MILKPCRGGCGTDLLDPKAPSQVFGICINCLKVSEPTNPVSAWRATKELRFHAGLDTVNLTELVDEEAGYRNVVVGGAETASEIESRYR